MLSGYFISRGLPAGFQLQIVPAANSSKFYFRIYFISNTIIKMANMTVIYRNPKDKESFQRHYFNVHIPLTKQLPGLKKYEISNGPIISPTGHSETYLVANLHFDSIEDIKKAFASEVGQRCALDRRVLAPGDDDIQIYLFDAIEV